MQEDGGAMAKPKVRMTLLVFQNVQQQRCVEWNPKTVEALNIAVSYSPKLFQIRVMLFYLFIIIKELPQFPVGWRLCFALY